MTNAITRSAELFTTVPAQVIRRYSREQKIALETAEQHFRELMKFLLASEEARTQLIPSREVDEAWHCFICHTAIYRVWTQEQFGHFVEHQPLDIDIADDTVPASYWSGVEMLKKLYGIQSQYWMSGAWSTTEGCSMQEVSRRMALSDERGSC